MNCPTDGTTLAMTDRQGIEIDYCPECRGVWLDRGELDKLIDRAPAAGPSPVEHPQEYVRPQEHYNEPPRDQRHSSDNYNNHGNGHKKRKKEGFLGDIFDF